MEFFRFFIWELLLHEPTIVLRYWIVDLENEVHSIWIKVETPYHENDLILTPKLSPQKWLTVNMKLPGTSHGRF